MVATIDPALTGNSRIFYIKNGSSPGHAPIFLGHGRSMGQSWPAGDETPIYLPGDQYGSYVVVGKSKGPPGLPTQGIQTRMPLTKSEVLELRRLGCPIDLHTHFGSCGDPEDFDGGWLDGHVRVLVNARITGYDTSDLGSFDGGTAEITEDLPLTGDEIIQISPLIPEEQAAAQLTDPVIAVVICDSKNCGACGAPSDGCQHAFAVTSGVTGSPGLPVEVLYTDDGGDTWGTTNIDTMTVAEVATHAACDGRYLYVESNGGDALHYASISEIIRGTETWTKVTTGIVAAGSPNFAFSLGRTKNWIVGDGGYIYFTEDITAGLTPQLSGGVTTQNLAGIHAYDSKNLLAVGASNVVLLSRNGGTSWALLTGPAAGINLTCVWMLTPYSFLVGTANGRLWYSEDGGLSWAEKAFPGSGAGVVRALSFTARNRVGYMAHDTVAPVGRVLRSINGGNTWQVTPEATGISTPDNDRISTVAACAEDPNVVFAGGIGPAGTDGILLKYS